MIRTTGEQHEQQANRTGSDMIATVNYHSCFSSHGAPSTHSQRILPSSTGHKPFVLSLRISFIRLHTIRYHIAIIPPAEHSYALQTSLLRLSTSPCVPFEAASSCCNSHSKAQSMLYLCCPFHPLAVCVRLGEYSYQEYIHNWRTSAQRDSAALNSSSTHPNLLFQQYQVSPLMCQQHYRR